MQHNHGQRRGSGAAAAAAAVAVIGNWKKGGAPGGDSGKWQAYRNNTAGIVTRLIGTRVGHQGVAVASGRPTGPTLPSLSRQPVQHQGAVVSKRQAHGNAAVVIDVARPTSTGVGCQGATAAMTATATMSSRATGLPPLSLPMQPALHQGAATASGGPMDPDPLPSLSPRQPAQRQGAAGQRERCCLHCAGERHNGARSGGQGVLL